jgi:hypothetical protein
MRVVDAARDLPSHKQSSRTSSLSWHRVQLPFFCFEVPAFR